MRLESSRWAQNATTGAEARNDFYELYAALKRRSSTVLCCSGAAPEGAIGNTVLVVCLKACLDTNREFF
jgi:hypothetical protein